MRNTVDATGKPIAVWSHSISDVTDPLVAFYDIHGRKVAMRSSTPWKLIKLVSHWMGDQKFIILNSSVLWKARCAVGPGCICSR
jgi:hypothetical protein